MNNDSRKRISLTLIIGGIILIATAMVVVTLIVMGRLHIAFTTSDTTVSYRSVSCSDENRKAYYQEYAKAEIDDTKLRELKETISSSPDFEDNPDCVYAALLYESIIARDEPKARYLLNILIALVERGSYLDNRYTNVADIESLKHMVDNINAPDDNHSVDGIG